MFTGDDEFGVVVFVDVIADAVVAVVVAFGVDVDNDVVFGRVDVVTTGEVDRTDVDVNGKVVGVVVVVVVVGVVVGGVVVVVVVVVGVGCRINKALPLRNISET